MSMTTSEKIARLFEIAGYIWLLPAILSFLYPVIFSIVLVLNGNVAAGIFLFLIPVLMFGSGVFLLVLYYRHSRGSLDDDLVIPLWAATLVFNLLLLALFACAFFALSNPAFYYPGQKLFTFTCGLLVFWLAAAILLSVTAIISQLKN